MASLHDDLNSQELKAQSLRKRRNSLKRSVPSSIRIIWQAAFALELAH